MSCIDSYSHNNHTEYADDCMHDHTFFPTHHPPSSDAKVLLAEGTEDSLVNDPTTVRAACRQAVRSIGE